MNIEAPNFEAVRNRLKIAMLHKSELVKTETWQGRSTEGKPEMATHELLNVTVRVPLFGVDDLTHWRRDIKPNIPWADDHFEERVCGEPLNPGVQWAKWPYAHSANTFRADKKFNHNYMERYWPRHAGHDCAPSTRDRDAERGGHPMCIPNRGIRGPFGDLHDLVKLLQAQPLTRQAYLPIFFPEDTGLGDNGRKPCTLGYHFIMREGYLHCVYPMRSCDLVRHFQDDVYLTLRLMLWIIDTAAERSAAVPEGCITPWDKVKIGTLTMHMTSLHCFVNDMIELRK